MANAEGPRKAGGRKKKRKTKGVRVWEEIARDAMIVATRRDIDIADLISPMLEVQVAHEYAIEVAAMSREEAARHRRDRDRGS